MFCLPSISSCVLAIALSLGAFSPVIGATIPAAANGLVINEIFMGSSAHPLAATDRYIELYNGSNETLYLDGKVIAIFGASATVSGGTLTGAKQAWRLPGIVGGRGQAIASGAFILIAANARKISGGLDLSGAQYETATGLPIIDEDGSALNLINLVGGQYTELSFSKSFDAIVLADGRDIALTDGLELSTIIDAVEYSNSGKASTFPPDLNINTAGGSELTIKFSIERKIKGVTTYNSAADFGVVPPSPGYQFGSAPDITKIKVSDLFPLLAGHYVQYDNYITDSTGAAQNLTKGYASSSTKSVNESFRGFAGVALVADSVFAATQIPISIVQQHYSATASGDIRAFADQSFFSTIVPSALSLLLTPPDSFVDYFSLARGFKTSYPVLRLAQTIDFQGVSATIVIGATGQFDGIDSVTVPLGHFDSSYRFSFHVNVAVSAILPLANVSYTHMLWLAKGVGIVKSNVPTVNGLVPILGSERQATRYGALPVGVAARSAVDDFGLFPQPAENFVRLAIPEHAEIRSAVATDASARSTPVDILMDHKISTKKLSSGRYQIVVEYVIDGAVQKRSAGLVIRR